MFPCSLNYLSFTSASCVFSATCYANSEVDTFHLALALRPEDRQLTQTLLAAEVPEAKHRSHCEMGPVRLSVFPSSPPPELDRSEFGGFAPHLSHTLWERHRDVEGREAPRSALGRSIGRRHRWGSARPRREARSFAPNSALKARPWGRTSAPRARLWPRKLIWVVSGQTGTHTSPSSPQASRPWHRCSTTPSLCAPMSRRISERSVRRRVAHRRSSGRSSFGRPKEVPPRGHLPGASLVPGAFLGSATSYPKAFTSTKYKDVLIGRKTDPFCFKFFPENNSSGPMCYRAEDLGKSGGGLALDFGWVSARGGQGSGPELRRGSPGHF